MGCDASSPQVFANSLTQREQSIDMVKGEGEPLAKVTGVMPAACCRQRRTIGVQDAVVKMAGIVDAEHRASAALSAQKGQIARDDAVIDAITNGKGWRDLPICFDLVTAGSTEPAEIGLPHGTPTA